MLHLGQPSVAVLGVGAILYGETSPAGRTIQTIYQQLGESCLFFFWIVANSQLLDFWPEETKNENQHTIFIEIPQLLNFKCRSFFFERVLTLRSSYQDQISIFDFNMRPGPSTFPRPDCTNHNITQCPKGTNPGRTEEESIRFFGNASIFLRI